MRRLQLRWLALCATLGVLTACDDEPGAVTFRVAASECLEETIATDTLCLAEPLRQIQALTPPNACLVIARAGENSGDIAHLPIAYDANGIDLTASGALTLTAGAPIDIALFLFTTPATDACRRESGLTARSRCLDFNGCMARLQRLDVNVREGEAIGFRGDDGRCAVERGPGTDDPESCDGTDEDCDGRVDEAGTESGLLEESCQGPIDIGECALPGRRVCRDGAFGECQGLHTPQEGICIADPSERVDNDCDGEVDEALNDCGGCDNQREQCNGIDDDCDGRTDEGLTGCMAMCEPRDELCNGRDDDCDNRADEHFDLTTPERCGACDNDCYADVTHADSSVFSCRAAECVLDGCLASFIDRDGEPANGCECGPIAAEIPYDGVDQDCDGRDYVGEVLHVAADAPAGGDGTPARPLRTLAQAIDAFRDRDLSAVTVLLARGTYRLAATLDVPDGVSIVGGFTRAAGEWQPPAAPMPAATTITGPGIVLRYADLGRDVALRDVRVQVDEAARAEGNSAAVAAERVASHLRIIHAELIGGPAAAGEAGAAGQNAPRGGARGGDGSSASDPACPGCGGLGASPIDCG
ncbi:MAG: hypothetical protein H6703_04730, partial [Myxococcales bacterium]|nr:hypothetical protein [Myxococcales bacterium]